MREGFWRNIQYPYLYNIQYIPTFSELTFYTELDDPADPCLRHQDGVYYAYVPYIQDVGEVL